MTDSFRNNRVFDFLQDKQVHDKGHEISLTAMGEHKGKWYVSDAQYPQFLDILHDHLFVKRLRSMNLVEQRRADGITPLTIDLDFRYPGEKALTRAFNADMIADFLRFSSDDFVLSPFLYRGWSAPRITFLLLWAPCILHALVPKAAGLLQGS
jgi:hypothetical protein